jgi:hypothetical protein
VRRTRQLCRAQQRSSTRSQTPACHRRRQSLTMRQRFPLLLTGAIRRQRPWSVEAQVPGVMAVGGDCWLRLGAPLSPHGDIGEEATAHQTGRRGPPGGREATEQLRSARAVGARSGTPAQRGAAQRSLLASAPRPSAGGWAGCGGVAPGAA